MEPIIFAIVVVAVVTILIRKRKRIVAGRWISLGRQLGLRYINSGHPELRGHIDNRQVCVKQGGKDDSVNFTKIEVHFQHILRVGFHLTRQSSSSLNQIYPGMRDIEIGHAEFDNRIIVQGRNQEIVRRYFESDQARDACMQVFRKGQYHNARINNQLISVSLVGGLNSLSYPELQETIGHLILIAEVLENEDASIRQSKKIVSPPPLPEFKEKPIVAVETLETETEPMPEAPRNKKNLVEVQEVVETREPVPREEPPIPVGVSLSDVTNLLFEEKLGRYEAGRRFEELLKDESVNWTAHLKSIEPGESDRVFGRGSGWIAVFDLGSVTGMGRGTGPLVAKVRIGRERKEGLEHFKDLEADLSGRLVKYDPFATTIYIDSGDPAEPETPRETPSVSYLSYAEKMKKEVHSRPGEVRRLS